MSIKILQIPCLQDNYGYLVRDVETGAVATIDTPDPDAINAALEQQGWKLTHIFNTHWHWDHTGGNEALKKRWNCHVIGPRGEADKIPEIDEAVSEGDVIELGASRAVVRDTPGHTAGHIIYHFADDHAAFVGDTIFALGCGRLFEGTPEQMWASLSKIATMPAETKLYCAHEYTLSNSRFALTIDPQNAALAERAAVVEAACAAGEPTVPTTVALELETNPFLRVDKDGVAAAVGLTGSPPAAVFAEVRKRKDNF